MEPTRRGQPGLAFLVTVAGAVVAVDQASKWLVVDRLGPDAARHRIEIFDRLFAFEYLENTGAAFGVLDGQGPLLTVFAAIVVMVLFTVQLRTGHSSAVLSASLGCLAGGAIGNVIDRVRQGYVVDFVAVGEWPKFNVADTAVTIGVILLAWAMMRDTEGSQRDRSRASHGDQRAPDDRNRLGMRRTAQRAGG